MPLDEALSDFKTDISPWQNPSGWIQADTEHINSIVEGIVTLTKRHEISLANFAGQDMIYQRLILYMFAHLMLCVNDKTLLDEFKDAVQKWKNWNTLTVLQNHQLIKDDLSDLFYHCLQSQPDSHSETLFRKLLTIDVVRLSAYLTIAVTDENKFKEIVSLRGQEAQSVINLLQARLDFSIGPIQKHRHVKALIYLSRASGQYPECLVLKDVTMDMTPVANGGCGDIYKGILEDQPIAVKVLKIFPGKEVTRLLKEFSSEAVIWRQISHPNILPFCGVYRLTGKARRHCLVAPWMENGNVVEFLRKKPSTNCVPLALDIALGLEYLHNWKPTIVHRDLKGYNVLITKSERACLADFGLATARDVTSNSTGGSGGTVRWQAPELHNPSSSGTFRNSKALDIYAFACVCYEMFSGNFPFYEIHQDHSVVVDVMEGKRPARPLHDLISTRGLSDELWNLIERCWAQNPSKRPTATEVVRQLRSLPNRPTDSRPFDESTIPGPSRVAYCEADHPFSALVPDDEDSEEMHDLKWVSRPNDSHQFDYR
jgi:hypothetical protein